MKRKRSDGRLCSAKATSDCGRASYPEATPPFSMKRFCSITNIKRQRFVCRIVHRIKSPSIRVEVTYVL